MIEYVSSVAPMHHKSLSKITNHSVSIDDVAKKYLLKSLTLISLVCKLSFLAKIE